VPRLGDYLGQVVSEITIARMHADLEAVRIAELYAGHPLLRHLAVPRFRLPEVTIDVPIVIDQVGELGEGQPSRGGLGARELHKLFTASLSDELKLGRIRLSAEQRSELVRVLDSVFSELEQPPEIAVDTISAAQKASTAAANIVARFVTEEKSEGLAGRLRMSALRRFAQAQPAPPRLNALVRTGEVREAGPIELITRVRLTISEESLDLVEIDSDGESRTRLVPE
jgi:hypothetical protein